MEKYDLTRYKVLIIFYLDITYLWGFPLGAGLDPSEFFNESAT